MTRLSSTTPVAAPVPQTGGWRIYVRPEHDDLVRDFVLTQNPTRLSQAALETLAVIAYKQPISRGAIASRHAA